MMFSGEKPGAVDDTMGRNAGLGEMTAIHGPTNHTRRETGAERGGDRPIRSDAPSRNLPGNFMYQVKK